MEFYISPQSGQFYMINVLENQWLSVTYKPTTSLFHFKYILLKWAMTDKSVILFMLVFFTFIFFPLNIQRDTLQISQKSSPGEDGVHVRHEHRIHQDTRKDANNENLFRVATHLEIREFREKPGGNV